MPPVGALGQATHVPSTSVGAQAHPSKGKRCGLPQTDVPLHIPRAVEPFEREFALRQIRVLVLASVLQVSRKQGNANRDLVG
jgi:hypothetical protein